jgi:membrane associated rhomboid family serine protease
LIALVVAAGTVTLALWRNQWRWASLEENPFYGGSFAAHKAAGAASGRWVVFEGESATIHWRNSWRLVTAPFLTGGVVHAVWHCFFGLKVMSELETRFGFARVALLFVTASLVGTWTTLVIVPDVLTTGSSCGFFGCLGGCFASLVHNVHRYHAPWWELGALLLWGTAGLAVGLAPLADNFGNILACIFGLFLGLVLFEADDRLSGMGEQRPTTARGGGSACLKCMAGAVAVAIAAIICFCVADGLVTIGEDAWCTECVDFSCVEIAWRCPSESDLPD